MKSYDTENESRTETNAGLVRSTYEMLFTILGIIHFNRDIQCINCLLNVSPTSKLYFNVPAKNK